MPSGPGAVPAPRNPAPASDTDEPEHTALTSCLETVRLPAGWRRDVYTQADGQRQCVLSPHELNAAPLVVPLASAGWQRIHVGVFRPRNTAARLRVKLSGDRYWRTIQPMVLINDPGGTVQDLCLGPWHVAQEDHLLIQPASFGCAAVAWVWGEQVAAPSGPRRKGRLGAVIDVHDVITQQYRIEEPDDLRAVIAPFADSGFDRICWGTAAGSFVATYFSDAMPVFGRGDADTPQARTAARFMEMFERHGEDPLDAVIDFAHDVGLELWADDRICHTFDPANAATRHLVSPFVAENQHMRVLDMDGQPSPAATLSLAYPQFRDLKVRFLTEQARRGVDGVYLDFTRKLPVVGWEEPVLDSFVRTHGFDPRQRPVEQWIHDWLSHQCEFVTTFIRELRASLDRVTGAGRRMPLAVQVPHGWHHTTGTLQCTFEGLDVATWASEGLVDIVVPSAELWYTPISLERFRAALRGTNCAVWGCVHQRAQECIAAPSAKMPEAHMDPWLIARAAADLLNQQAEGIFLWEAGELPTVPQRWDVLGDMGDRERLCAQFVPRLGPYDSSQSVKQLTLQ